MIERYWLRRLLSGCAVGKMLNILTSPLETGNRVD